MITVENGINIDIDIEQYRIKCYHCNNTLRFYYDDTHDVGNSNRSIRIMKCPLCLHKIRMGGEFFYDEHNLVFRRHGWIRRLIIRKIKEIFEFIADFFIF